MKKNYQDEINKVHAPQELILQTKEKMKRESRRIGKVDKKLIRISSFSAIAATIVLSFILISLTMNRTTIKNDSFSDQNSIHLSNGNKEPEKIEKSEETEGEIIYTKDKVKVYLIDKIPNEFQSSIVEKDIIEEFPISLIKDESSSFFKAVIKVDNQNYLMLSEIVEMEEILNSIKDFLKTFE